MKRLTNLALFFLVLFFTNLTNAQNLIAVQNGSTTKFYQLLDDAVVNSIDGDTIYIPGGNYPISKNINKRIHIVGVGHNPDSTAATNFTYLTGNISILPGADGGSMSGLYMLNYITMIGLNSDVVIKDFSISRCNILSISGSYVSNILINENVFRYALNIGNSSKILISNNILSDVYSGPQTTLRNNIILNFLGCESCLVENNILIAIPSIHGYGCSPNCCSCGNSIFQNNLFVEGITLQYGTWMNLCPTIMHNNNIENQQLTSIFVNQSGNTHSYTQDYHLQSSSPGKNAGRDGTDIGIYGGAFPWKEGSIPFNPHFQAATIAPKTDASGNLNIQIKVSAQDN